MFGAGEEVYANPFWACMFLFEEPTMLVDNMFSPLSWAGGNASVSSMIPLDYGPAPLMPTTNTLQAFTGSFDLNRFLETGVMV